QKNDRWQDFTAVIAASVFKAMLQNCYNILSKSRQPGCLRAIKALGFEFKNLYFRSEYDRLVDTLEFGFEKKFVYRYEFISLLLDLVRKAGITIEFGKKLDHIVNEP
ncbi:unnamed protein product, partial [Clonostachys solani]